MEAYSDFAKVYDIFMDETPYQAWRDVLLDILRENKITDGIIAELGCGTGVMTELLADQGYDMIGIDNSEEMLGIAAEKRSAKNSSILYLNQDMRELELYGTASDDQYLRFCELSDGTGGCGQDDEACQ